MTAALIIAALIIATLGVIYRAQRREIERLTDHVNTNAGRAWKLQLALLGITSMDDAEAMAKIARDAVEVKS